MKTLSRLALLLLALTSTLVANPLANNIRSEALIVTKAELRRHMAAAEDDAFRPATYRELAASLGDAQPDYLVVRFLTTRLGHYTGEAEARVNGSPNGFKINVVLHYNKGWVEYFIPLDSMSFGPPHKDGSPKVVVTWNKLETK